MRRLGRLIPGLLLLASLPAGAADLPLSVGGGFGSQIGNYPLVQSGEFTNSLGQLCKIFNWDRPLGPYQVLRVRSASCPDFNRPGSMMGVEIDRRIVPMSESPLRFLPPEPAYPGSLALADARRYPR